MTKRILSTSSSESANIRSYRYGTNKTYIAMKKDDFERNMSEQTKSNFTDNSVECNEWEGYILNIFDFEWIQFLSLTF